MKVKEQSIEAILRKLVSEKGITKVARDLGIDHASLYRSLKDNSNLKWGRIKKLLDYFGYEFRIVRKRVNHNPTLRS